MPTKKVNGTLITKAQGQDTTRNIKALFSHIGKLSPKPPSPKMEGAIPKAPSIGGTTAKAMAAKTTMGVYTRAKRVMKASLFDLFSSALSTKAIIFETVLSPKLFVLRTLMTPLRLMQPEMTSSPSFKSRGTLSPVNATVFNAELPSMTTPSRGTFSPGFTKMVSPTFTSSGETVSTLPSLSTLATSGRMSIRCEMLARLFPSAYPSKSSPI